VNARALAACHFELGGGLDDSQRVGALPQGHRLALLEGVEQDYPAEEFFPTRLARGVRVHGVGPPRVGSGLRVKGARHKGGADPRRLLVGILLDCRGIITTHGRHMFGLLDGDCCHINRPGHLVDRVLKWSSGPAEPILRQERGRMDDDRIRERRPRFPERLNPHVAIMLIQEAQKAFVISRRQVEELNEFL
jgi:hypothetical protein